MRAAVFKQPGKPLVLERRPDPVPGSGEVVVKVGYCGICGSDLHMTELDAGATFPLDSVIGHEFSGAVVAVGAGVERLRVGDRIAAMPMTGCGRCTECLAGTPKWCRAFAGIGGGFAEYSLASAQHSIRLPNSLSLEDGALVEPLAVGLHGVVAADLKPENRVLIIGAGPVGISAAFWARRLGAGRIVVTALSRRREVMAMEVGASAFIVPEQDAVAEGEASLGGAADVVFECAGVRGVLTQALAHVRPRGVIVSLGYCLKPDPLVPAAMAWKEVTIKFPFAYSLRDFEIVAETLDAGHVEPRCMVTERVGLEGLPLAFEALRGRNANCKVLVNPA